MKRTTVLVVDDHELVRRGIASTIQSCRPDFEICGEARNGREAVTAALTLRPDIVIMDVSMSSMNGVDAVRQILRDQPHVGIIVLSEGESEQIVDEALRSGARGFVLKTDAADDLITALDAVRCRKVFLSTRISDILLRAYIGGPADALGGAPPRGQLTSREREIVQLIAESKSNKEIANTLSISVKTVETHRARLMEKLDLHTVSDLVRYAIRNHIIQA